MKKNQTIIFIIIILVLILFLVLTNKEKNVLIEETYIPENDFNKSSEIILNQEENEDIDSIQVEINLEEEMKIVDEELNNL
jgi:hypothetical protein